MYMYIQRKFPDLHYDSQHKLKIMKITSYRSLVLHGCYRVTSTGIKYLNKGLSNLQTLDVTDCPQVTPQVTPEALELTGTIAVQLTEKEEM